MYSVTASCIFISYMQIQIFSPDQVVEYWRYIICWPIIPLTIKAIFIPVLIQFDSPKFCINKHHSHSQLKEKLVSIYSQTHRESQVHEACDNMIKVRRSDSNDNTTFRSLFRPGMRRRFFTGILVAVCEECSGMTFLAAYSFDIFNRINGSGKTMISIIAVTKLFGGAGAMYCMKNFGRKVNLTIAPLLQGISMTVLVVSLSFGYVWCSYVGLVFFIIFYAAGFGGTFVAYTTEILPPRESDCRSLQPGSCRLL
jgi:hypothetical protein